MMPMSRDALAQVCCGRLLDYVVERNQAVTADKRALAELAAAGDLFSKGVEHGGLSASDVTTRPATQPDTGRTCRSGRGAPVRRSRPTWPSAPRPTANPHGAEGIRTADFCLAKANHGAVQRVTARAKC